MIRAILLGATLWMLAGLGVQAASGVVAGLDPAASATKGKVVKVLEMGSDIAIGDTVTTDAKGIVQIVFSDKTRLVVGPSSSLVIEDYLLREDGSAGKLAIDALAGTFRFITGKARKDLYEITTPTALIGVRGTAFDFNVTAEETSLLLYDGSVNLCSTSKTCVTVTERCQLGASTTTESRIIGLGDSVQGALRQAFKAQFPYSLSQKPLLYPFRLEGAEDCTRRRTLPVEEPDSNQPKKPQKPNRD